MSADANHHLESIDEPTTHHEESDVNIRAIFLFTAGLVAVAVVVHLAVWGLFVLFERRETARAPEFPMAVASEPRVPPAPRLQERPREEFQEHRLQEDAILNGYTWVNREAGLVRIPIAEAMRLTVERGLPVRPAQELKP
jgi:hypothetical protein